jgi:hypothetical protein
VVSTGSGEADSGDGPPSGKVGQPRREWQGGAGLPEPSEGEPGEPRPPQPCAGDADAGGEGAVDAERIGQLDEGDGDAQVDAAAHVADGVALGAHLVDGVGGGDLGQEPVVEHVARHEPHLGHEEQDQGECHVAGGGEEQQQGEDGPSVGETR